VLDEALKVRAAYEIQQTCKKMFSSTEKESEKVNTLFGVDIVTMCKSHLTYVTFQIFKGKIESLPSNCDENMKKHLIDLIKVFALDELVKNSDSCYETGYFKQGAMLLLSDAMQYQLRTIRPQIIPLIESFFFIEDTVPSAIGNYYGDIYETQLEWA
jgi:hypothetical protein